MALIAYDGFDHYASSTDMQQRFGALQWADFSNTLSFTTPGRAGFGKSLNVSGYFIAGLAAQTAKLTQGFAVNFEGNASTLTVQFIDAVTGFIQIEFDISPVTGLIQAYTYNGAARNSSPLQTGLNCISTQGWFFVELQATASATAGTVAIRINGTPIASFPDQTNLDILNPSASAATFSQVRYQTFGTLLMDDLYLADGTTGPGSYPCNSFVGDVRVATLFPVGNGTVTWAPSDSGTDNWNMVAETAFDGDTTYNRTNTAGAQDLLNFQALTATINQVIAVQATGAYRKEDAGSRTLANVVKSGGATAVQTARSPDVSYLYFTDLLNLDPNTSASWTVSAVNALQAGYKVVT